MHITVHFLKFLSSIPLYDSHIINIPHQSGTFVTTDECALTHHYHPESKAYIYFHSWCCTLYEFGQIYNDIYPQFWASQVAPVVKKPPASAGRHKRCEFNPWVWKTHWRRTWQPIPVFLPGKPRGQRSLAGNSPWAYKRARHDLVTKHHKQFIAIYHNQSFHLFMVSVLFIYLFLLKYI